MRKFRVCVIGCGVISSSHLGVLSKNEQTEIVGVCDILPQKARQTAEAYGCAAYTDYKIMISDLSPDAVHICLPHWLHAEVSVYCLEHGIRVLCEKPMNAHLSGAVAMKETSERTGVPLGIIFQNRYNAGSVMAKEIISSGRLGDVLSVTGQVIWERDQAYYDQDPWRTTWTHSGGGVCVNQAIHTLDLMRWLTAKGCDTVHIAASVSHHGETSVEVEDTAEGVVDFSNGVRMLFYFTINNRVDNNISVTVNGTLGTLYIEGASCRAEYRDGTTETEDKRLNGSVSGAKQEYGFGHELQIAEFYRDETGEKIRETMNEALRTQQLLHDIYTCAGIEV